MRIAQLDLKAFGHFTNRRIAFEPGADLHLAYGPNEAGKTTISRALHAALFGVPEQTPDTHLHGGPDLRVGVVLESASGGRLAAMRRKKRANSLVTYDPLTGEELPELIPDEMLSKWMGGLGRSLYESMFGIDHEGLVAGGKALAEGKGEVGQSLFSAGAGLASVKALRDRLGQEADGLFRPRASSSSIYKTLEAYDGARREVKAAQRKPAEWEALCKAVEEARRHYDAARQRQEDLQLETRQLERLSALLPDVATRAEALSRLSAMGEVTKLRADASNARVAAEARLSEATQAQAEARDNLARIEAEIVEIVLPELLLAEAGPIESLYYSLESFRAAREAGAGAKARLEQSQERTNGILAAIGEPGANDARSLIPGATLRSRVQSLVTTGAKLQSDLGTAKELAASARRDRQELEDELAEIGSQEVPAALADFVAGTESQGNPESKAEELAKEAARLWDALLRDAGALQHGSVEDIVGMRVPLPTEIQRFRDEKDGLETRAKALKDKVEGIEDDIVAVQGEIAGLIRDGDIPTAEQLAGDRAARDTLWQKIRRKVFPEANQARHEEALPTAAEYESTVSAADSTADRRFKDVARVAQHAELQKRLTQMHMAIELEKNRLMEADQAIEALKREWQALVVAQKLPPLGVNEIAEWLSRRSLLLQRHDSYLEKKADSEVAAGHATESRRMLSSALAEAGLSQCAENEPLSQAIARARSFAKQANENATSRTLLTRKLKPAERKIVETAERIDACEKELGEWRDKWEGAMTAIRLGIDSDATEATTRLQQFDGLEKSLEAFDSAKAELAAAQATTGRVEVEVERLCQATGLDRGGMLADGVIETLHRKLLDAQDLSQRWKELEVQRREVARSLNQAAALETQASDQLALLMKAACCETLAELSEAESRSAERDRLESQVSACEAKLVQGSGTTLSEFLVQAEGRDLAQVEASLERAALELKSAKEQVEALHEKLIGSENALGEIDGEADAAEAEQRATDAAARLTTLAGDYAASRLSSAILGEVIEAYQQRHQGPMLARASELFSAITGGRFLKVVTDFENDLTVLVAVRPDGKRLTVDKLSSGRRDQLFLALRLAAIESHVSKQEPMPVILDDILINFDDEASSATFKVLADLAKKTQVLYFTHHAHLLGNAESSVGSPAFKAHKL